MNNLADLDLPFLPMNEQRFADDPLSSFAQARRQHPWLATCPFGYVVHELTAINELLSQDERLRTSFDGIVEAMNARGTPWGRFTESQMIARTGADHKRLRNLLAPKFTPRQANAMRELMRTVIEELLDEWATHGAFDFELFASYFPISVMVTMVGAPREAIPRLRSSMETLGMGFSMDPALMPRLQEAIGILDTFAHDLMQQRRTNPLAEGESDLLELMMAASREGNLSDRELANLLIFFFVAGYDTSKNVLTYLMHLMIDHPAIYERCAGDLEYCHKTVEEGLRYFSPATTFRMTREAITFRDVLLPADTMLFFPLSIAGHDPCAFSDPETFDPDRPLELDHRHVAFGRGVHMCLGQHIARAQLQEGLHLIAQRIRNPRRTGPHAWRPFMGTWGIRGLPIAFTSASES